MGTHFDALVEFASKHVKQNEALQPYIPNLGSYLRRTIGKAALFGFPMKSDEILPKSGKDKAEYNRYVTDYFSMSAQYGAFFLTPFHVTAVEDAESVVIMDWIDGNEFLLTSCRTYYREDKPQLEEVIANIMGRGPKPEPGSPHKVTTFYCGCVRMLGHTVEGHKMKIVPLMASFVRNSRGRKKEERDDVDLTYDIHVNKIANAILLDSVAYVEEVIYIMDPENFIIRKENNQSRQQRARKGKGTGRKRKRSPLRKTVLRPHYIFLSEQDTGKFLCSQSKTPMAAHPVRGHWRTLRSSRFVRKKGQRIYIKQYFTGDGKIEAPGGWQYEVMIKERPDRIVPYSSVS
jgi:hypothetical protein